MGENIQTENVTLPRAAKWFIVLTTMLQAITFYLLTEHHFLPNLWQQTAIIMLIAIPLFTALVLTQINDKKMWGVIAIYSGVLFLTAYYTAFQCSGYANLSCNEEHWFQFAAPQIIAWFIILFFTQVWLRSKEHHFSYHALFNASWSNIITLKLTILFLLIFAGLLTLWAALFNIVGISLFEDLFQHPWFSFPVGGVMLGIGIINFRQRLHTVDLVLNILQVLMQWLLPVVSLMSILFLVALLFTGLDPLWDTDNATGMMLWLVSLLLFFSNAVYLTGENATQHNRVYNGLIKLSLFLSPIYVLLASVGLMIRVNDYGWTVGRLWVLIIILLLAGFTLTYSISLIKKTDNWFSQITHINRLLAVCIAVVSLLVTSPIIDLQKISVQSQIDLLKQGQVSIENFDYKYLRFKTGRAGYEAIVALKDYQPIKNNAQQMAYIDKVLVAKNKWSIDDNDIDNIKKFKQLIAVYPKNTRLPEALLNELFKNKHYHKACKRTQSCFVLGIDIHGDEAQEYIFNQNRHSLNYAEVYGLEAGQWKKIGHSKTTQKLKLSETKESLLNHDYVIKPSAWKTLNINGVEIEFNR